VPERGALLYLEINKLFAWSSNPIHTSWDGDQLWISNWHCALQVGMRLSLLMSSTEGHLLVLPALCALPCCTPMAMPSTWAKCFLCTGGPRYCLNMCAHCMLQCKDVGGVHTTAVLWCWIPQLWWLSIGWQSSISSNLMQHHLLWSKMNHSLSCWTNLTVTTLKTSQAPLNDYWITFQKWMVKSNKRVQNEVTLSAGWCAAFITSPYRH